MKFTRKLPFSRKALTGCWAVLICICIAVNYWTTPAGAQANKNNEKPVVESEAQEGPESADFKLQPAVGLLFEKWQSEKSAMWEFSLQNKNKDSFDELKLSDLRVTLDGNPVTLKPNSLRLTRKDPISFAVLLDGSLSMCNTRTGCIKLDAAKGSLTYFVKTLNEKDSAAIAFFDSDFHTLVNPTSNKMQLADAANAFKPEAESPDTKRTDLYSGVTKAIDWAKNNNIRNLIVISDGMQDTDDSRAILDASEERFAVYKQGNERTISERARRSGVRIFSVPIGDNNSVPKDWTNLAYVDKDTLCSISGEATSGICTYIDLVELQKNSQGSKELYQNLLETKLKETLIKIRQSASYGYALDIPLADLPQDGKTHILKIVTTVPIADGKAELPVEYPLHWSAGDVTPFSGTSVVFQAIFLTTPKAVVTPKLELSLTYFSMLGLLLLLSFIPPIVIFFHRRYKKISDKVIARRSVEVLGKDSKLIGDTCPNDAGYPFKAGNVVVACPGSCKRTYHLDCWEFGMFRCMTRDCTGELPISEEMLKQYGLNP